MIYQAHSRKNESMREESATFPDLGLATVHPNDLVVRAPFKDLFPIRPSVQESVETSMRRDGFDHSKPIVVWRSENVVVDGHTRRLAAQSAGIDVLISFHDFRDEDEALAYAIASQRDRRNLTDADISRLVEIMDQKRKAGRPGKFATRVANSERSADKTAELIGTSRGKVEKVRTLIEYATPDVHQAVKSGRISINKAYKRTVQRKEASKGQPQSPVSTNGHATAQDQPANGQPAPPLRRPVEMRRATPTVEQAALVTPAPYDARPEPHPRTLTDREWLDTLPLQSHVNAQKFDAAALIVRHLATPLKAIREDLARVVGARSPDVMGALHKLLFSSLDIPPIETWYLCDSCSGKGFSTNAACKPCKGGGYLIPGILPRRAK